MNNKIGFMQGRLCNQIDGKIQAFPWHDWELEFSVAESINLNIMEWTLDQDRLYQNPLMNADGQKKIRLLSHKHGISIPSLTGDCFMQAPFWKSQGHEQAILKEEFKAICIACAEVGIKMVVIPLVDNGRLENTNQENILIEFLIEIYSLLSRNNIHIIFESDSSPVDLARMISKLPSDRFGINYDMGNSAALGFDPTEEFDAYGLRVMNIHVKDRLLGGTTVPLTKGNTDFEKVFTNLAKYHYKGNYILQTARAENEDHANILIKYRNMTMQWLSNSLD